MYHVQLKRINSTHTNLRTPKVTGVMSRLPKLGREMCLTSKPLDRGAVARIISTTPIKKLRVRRLGGKRVFIVDTHNSRYRLTVIRQLTVS